MADTRKKINRLLREARKEDPAVFDEAMADYAENGYEAIKPARRGRVIPDEVQADMYIADAWWSEVPRRDQKHYENPRPKVGDQYQDLNDQKREWSTGNNIRQGIRNARQRYDSNPDFREFVEEHWDRKLEAWLAKFDEDEAAAEFERQAFGSHTDGDDR